MTALLFLPVMMLGLSAIEQAAPLAGDRFLWIGDLGNIDPAYLFPMSFTILAGLYLQMTLARTVKQRMLSWGLAVPLLFAMVFKLTAAGTIYLNISLVLLLLQRAYVAGGMTQLKFKLRHIWRKWQVRVIFQGIVPLHYADLLKSSGNKAYRLAVMSTAGFSVPIGVVAGNAILQDYPQMSEVERHRFFDRLWHMVEQKTCVVRSSGADEDGADQSFAGVFDSVLDVDRAGLQGAFETVLKSFQSARAGFYQGGGSTAHRGNILIQQMVDAAYAGVLFTQDPMAPGQMLLELATGTADDLVSGRVTPLSLRFGKFTNKKCDEATAPIDLAALLAVGRDIEQLFGCPQDIEWTYLEGAFSVVQSRDITTLNLGTDTELARQAEWGRIFAGFDNSTLNGPILQQDEMSEVLPRPTPLSPVGAAL